MKLKVATAWLGGCSGCHMSFLDLDERLIELADKIELVHSPFADIKNFPDGVDFTLVEGAVTNSENLELARIIRKKSKWVISFGDCAVTGNVTAMRNFFTKEEILKHSYMDLSSNKNVIPDDKKELAGLIPTARPLHEFIKVDAFLHGCPPTAEQIWFAMTELIEGRLPVFQNIFLRYG